jgi:hypothetical protein
MRRAGIKMKMVSDPIFSDKEIGKPVTGFLTRWALFCGLVHQTRGAAGFPAGPQIFLPDRKAPAMSETFTLNDRRRLQAGSAHPGKRLNQNSFLPDCKALAMSETFTLNDRRRLQAVSAHPGKRLNQNSDSPRPHPSGMVCACSNELHLSDRRGTWSHELFISAI